MMPTCSSRRSPRPFTAGIPPILGTEPGVSSASAGTGGGQWAGARGEEVEGGAGRTEGSWLENPRALQGPRDWTLRGGPSTWGPVLAGGRAALPASSQVPSWGPRPPRCVHVRTHARARTGRHAPEERTHMHTCDLHTHACMRAHKDTHSALPHTRAYTLAHTPHICAHAPPSRASRALGCNLGSRSPRAAPDLQAPGPVGLARPHGAAVVPQAPRPRPARPRLCALHSMHRRAHLHAPPSPARPCADPTNAGLV